MFDFFSLNTLRDALVPLFMSVLLGGIIGAERQWRRRPAGLRTILLVCVGSAIFTIVSYLGFGGSQQQNPSRVAAQVVSGVGFLGAGLILRKGERVQGLNTAATLWVAAGVGMAAGAELYPLAIFSTLFILLVQVAGRSLASQIDRRATLRDLRVLYEVTVESDQARLQGLGTRIAAELAQLEADKVSSKIRRKNDRLQFVFLLQAPRRIETQLDTLFEHLSDAEISSVAWRRVVKKRF